jgi:hypothetical protein
LKTGLLQGVNLALTILAVALCFVPLILYWRKKLAPDKSYLIISLYWAINGVLYTPEIFHWQWYTRSSTLITLYYNLIDAPLVILAFYFAFRKRIFLYLLGAFIVYELLITVVKGFNLSSDVYIIGLGSLIALTLNVWAITRYFMKVPHSDTENAFVFVNAGYIFYYGLFAVVYNYNYLNESGTELPYVVFINYTAICLACILLSYGMWKYAYTEYSDERF